MEMSDGMRKSLWLEHPYLEECCISRVALAHSPYYEPGRRCGAGLS